MIITFQGLFKGRWRFGKAPLAESTEELRNPARGWYHIHMFMAHEPPRYEEVALSLNSEETLVLVIIDIGAYQNRPLDDSALANIRGILQFFTEHHRDVILRIVYDHEGRAQEREPFEFARVLEHLEQLGPLLEAYAERIFVYQGLLVGNWGEMHGSRYLSTMKLARMAEILRGHLTGFLAVRTPMHWRALNPQARGEQDFSTLRMGLFDDAIWGSDTHLGTFGAQTEPSPDWNARWSPEEELAFEDALCQHAPQGGEALYEPEAAERRSLCETVARLRIMHISYLNSAYDERLLGLWKGMVWDEPGPWSGVSGYDYIGRHLGYRFCVRNVTVNIEKADGGCCCRWGIEIENTGFARCYQEAVVWLAYPGEDGQPCRQELSFALESILPGETGKGVCVTPAAEGKVRLFAARRRDGAAIRFANATEDDGGVLLGQLDRSGWMRG